MFPDDDDEEDDDILLIVNNALQTSRLGVRIQLIFLFVALCSRCEGHMF